MRTCAPATFNNPSIFHPHFSSVIVSFSTSFASPWGEQVHISSIFEFYRYSRYLSSCYLNYNIMATHFSNHHIRGLIVLAHLIQFNLTHIHYLNTQIRTDKQAIVWIWRKCWCSIECEWVRALFVNECWLRRCVVTKALLTGNVFSFTQFTSPHKLISWNFSLYSHVFHFVSTQL